MSRAQLHVFVEGRQLDGYVYAKLCRKECATPFAYRIVRADELPSAQSGGKSRLLEFFNQLRRSGKLLETFKGQRHAVLFFLDKDIDDLTGRGLRSPHLVYTQAYDLEGDVYRAGDLAEALGATCSVSPDSVRAAMSPLDWREQATLLWQDWVELCVAAQLVRARGVVNFGVTSRVNVPPVATADQNLVQQYEQMIVTGCPLSTADAAVALQRARRRVSRLYASGSSHRVFKGKWFGEIIQQFAVATFGASCTRVAGFSERLVGHMAQSADYDAPWARHYRAPVASMLVAIAAP
jgi:hypothetical protein